jgi:hypothetical protein
MIATKTTVLAADGGLLPTSKMQAPECKYRSIEVRCCDVQCQISHCPVGHLIRPLICRADLSATWQSRERPAASFEALYIADKCLCAREHFMACGSGRKRKPSGLFARHCLSPKCCALSFILRRSIVTLSRVVHGFIWVACWPLGRDGRTAA